MFSGVKMKSPCNSFKNVVQFYCNNGAVVFIDPDICSLSQL